MNELNEVCLGLEPDALRVLIEIAKRLQVGQAVYGKMDLKSEKRDLRREGAEELLDYVVYECMFRLKGG